MVRRFARWVKGIFVVTKNVVLDSRMCECGHVSYSWAECRNKHIQCSKCYTTNKTECPDCIDRGFPG